MSACGCEPGWGTAPLANSGDNAVQTLPRASPGPYIGTAGAGDGGVNWQRGRRSSRPGGHLGDLGCTPYANGTVGLVCGVTVVDPADPLCPSYALSSRRWSRCRRETRFALEERSTGEPAWQNAVAIVTSDAARRRLGVVDRPACACRVRRPCTRARSGRIVSSVGAVPVLVGREVLRPAGCATVGRRSGGVTDHDGKRRARPDREDVSTLNHRS